MVAHPGHELRVHGWLETKRPITCILTDGSGRTNHSRLDSTTRVLEAAGCFRGPIYGFMTDQDLYASVLNFHHARFVELVDELATLLVREQIDCIAGDAEEGYNPAHDICRLLINGAVGLANNSCRQPIQNLDFTLIGAPEQCAGPFGRDAMHVRLDERALARKLAAARNYPELQGEVTAALAGAGSLGLQQHPDLAGHAGVRFATANADLFAVECLRQVATRSIARDAPKPFYELYGERQVTAGHYTRVLRYRKHMLPLAEAISCHVQKKLSAG